MLGRSTGSRCDEALIFKKNKKEFSINQSLSERRDGLLRGRMCCVSLRMSMRTFHRWGGLVFIVYVFLVGW